VVKEDGKWVEVKKGEMVVVVVAVGAAALVAWAVPVLPDLKEIVSARIVGTKQLT